MKIYFEQSGGLIGIENRICIDNNSLNPDEGLKLQHLIDDAKFFDLPRDELAAPPKHGADYFEYIITIETKGRKHYIKTTDLTMPPNLGPLIRFLRQKAQRMDNKLELQK
jgi:hypothetical protein